MHQLVRRYVRLAAGLHEAVDGSHRIMRCAGPAGSSSAAWLIAAWRAESTSYVRLPGRYPTLAASKQAARAMAGELQAAPLCGIELLLDGGRREFVSLPAEIHPRDRSAVESHAAHINDRIAAGSTYWHQMIGADCACVVEVRQKRLRG